MIRYRRSPCCKLCQLGIESVFLRNVSLGSYSSRNEKSKHMGSGGSIVARLKLKGIDGMAPQGVEYAA